MFPKLTKEQELNLIIGGNYCLNLAHDLNLAR